MLAPLPGSLGRQIDDWFTSERQLADAVRAELNLVTVELIVRLALRKGKGRGDEEVHMSPCTTSISVV